MYTTFLSLLMNIYNVKIEFSYSFLNCANISSKFFQTAFEFSPKRLPKSWYTHAHILVILPGYVYKSKY